MPFLEIWRLLLKTLLERIVHNEPLQLRLVS